MTNLFRNKYLIPSTRLAGYDYRQSGYYFITICAKNRLCYFGDIIGDEMMLNDIGEMAIKYWLEIPKHFNNVVLGEFIIMPNHMHGIIQIVDGCRRDEAMPRLYTDEHANQYNGEYPQMSTISPKPRSLSTIIGSYKSICTKTMNKLYVNNYFAWQTRFYDHIIRNEQSFHNIRQYIINNPIMWDRDRNNPEGLIM